MSRDSKYQIDMRTGSLLKKMIIFAVPLFLTGALQLFYNAADIIVVGRFAGEEALAAVGATSALINLMINIFIGLSVGTSVVISNFFGAHDIKGIKETVHTSILVAGISGVVLIVIGYFAAKPMLELMNTPTDVIEGATLYMRIYYLGMPFNLLYTFGAAILRAVGDTKRPLYFLTISGVINVLLNLYFVIVLRIGIAGVAWATIMSQVVSCVLVLRCLIKSDSVIKLSIKDIKLHGDKLWMVFKIGFPAGLQGSMFSISNMMIQSSINSFGSLAVAANTASGNIEGFIFIATNSVQQTNVTFASQNIGAKQYKRVKQVFYYSLTMTTVVGLAIGSIFFIFSEPLLSLYNDNPEVIKIALERLHFLCFIYFLAGIMDVTTGQLRSVGYSTLSMIVSVFGICGFRAIWIYTAFAANPTLETLYASYPITWTLTSIIQFICYYVLTKNMPKQNEPLALE